METSLLRTIAVAILTSIEGNGRWRTDSTERPEFEKIKNPLLGLSVGDIVYSYSEDDEAMVEDRVLVVADGIGYIFCNMYYWGPTLVPVDDEAFAITREAAVDLWRSTIESDIEWSQGKADRLPGLKALLDSKTED